MSDAIVLSGIELFAWGGTSEAEQAVGQRYSITVELRLDLDSASRSDSIEDTVSYADVHDRVVAAARERPFHLIESLAGSICDRLLETYKVEAVTTEVRKLLPPIDGVVAYAAVRVTRGGSS